MIIMSKTYTPELTPEVLDRLKGYADVFRDDFSHQKQALWSGVYLQGLLQDGERKSIEPLSARVTLDRKSTRLNSSHMSISYAVFCLKKKKKQDEVTCDENMCTSC